MSFSKLKSILQRNGYGKIMEELSQQQAIDMIKDEILDEDLDLNRSFEENEKVIYDKFYDKTGLVFTLFSQKRM